MSPSRALQPLAAVLLLLAPAALHAGERGDLVQTDTLGMNLVSHDFTTGATRTVSDASVLSEFIGLHAFIFDGVRVGMNLQFSETLRPTPAAGKSRFATFALLPQIGWEFYGPLFAALVYTIAPRTGGGANFDMGLQGVLGVGIPLAKGIKLNLALEVPFNFYIDRTLGITPLVGLGFKL